MFDPGLKIGQVLKNTDIVEIFKCGNMGGMRRSKATNTLVLITDYTKGLYHDKWISGVLHYTGMGKLGDQDINWAQNATLAASSYNGVDPHLFEVIDPGEYIYCGRVELADKPYVDIQPGEDGSSREVWMFPIRPIPDNNVKKPKMFVFKDIEDYNTHGKTIDAEYIKLISEKKKSKISKPSSSKTANPALKVDVTVPPDIIGKRLIHKSYGEGIVTNIFDSIITVSFSNVGEKKIGYDFCVQNNVIQFI